MKTQVEVLVIGGGIGGCSALYHLTQEGITDCVLLERDELTSGTTWHSAAQVTNLGPNQTMVGLKTHSINLYKELADDPEYPINYHHGTGGLRLASEQWHMDGYLHFQSMAKGMGVELDILDAEECKRRHPLITTDNLLGALWDPLDGDIDPAQLCQALARRARLAGAEIYRHTSVIGLTQRPDHTWIVRTNKGDIHAEKIVNAGGYRCNEIGAMMGVEHPVASMEHQYMLTEAIPEIEALGDDFRVPLIRCPTDDFYQRAEKKGLLIGFYEQDCKTWGLDGIDPDFTNALCPDDLDRVVDVMEGAIARLPCLETAGIHSIINGPITYTPDGLPLVGQIPGKRNAYCITGLRAGLGEGGGHGWLLAQIIAHGEACYDTWCIDPRRFTRYADVPHTALKAIEDYQNEFRFHRPHEHRPAGRMAKTTALYDVLKAAGGSFAPVNGWERLDYIKPDPDFTEELSFHFNNVHPLIAREVAMVQNGVGLCEVNGFNRFEITGATGTEDQNVHDWLDTIVCSRVPRKVGKVGLTYLLNHHGMVKGEATLANLHENKVWYGSAAASEAHDMDWLTEHLPDDGSIQIKSLTNDYTILVLAGPKSRNVLQAVMPDHDISAKAFKPLCAIKANIAGVEIILMSVSFSGELAYEVHIPNDDLVTVHDALMAAGKVHNIGYFGMRAVESMRLEMGYLHWKADIITEYNPYETGVGFFTKIDKESDFIGKSALEKMVAKGVGKTTGRKLVTLELNSKTTPARPGDSIMQNGIVVGTITSAGWGHRANDGAGKNLAYAFVDVDAKDELTALVLGGEVEATIINSAIYSVS
ncbi:FAD-dependent oxidoreductase [Lentilitoribacter sp. EG35]|uniref:FAD-dependent oxidoreductase n=1 Tax=Lentilitoribacter sp. EG35 TaxID=3234192 RepID=UPI003460F609